MKTRILFAMASLILALALAVPAMAADVAQGKCISYDKEKKAITIEEYDLDFSKSKYGNPTGKQLVLNVSDARIGVEPEPGHVLRISYDDKTKKAFKVMNVTKQDIMKK